MNKVMLLWALSALAVACSDNPATAIEDTESALDTRGGDTGSEPTDIAGGLSDGASMNEVLPADGENDDSSDAGMLPSDINPSDLLEDVKGTEGWSLLNTCGLSAGEVYALTSAELDMTKPRGTVHGCNESPEWSIEEVDQELSALGFVAQNAVRRFRVSYTTERSFGAKGLATASVLLPNPKPPEAVPVLIVTHGTAGMADKCAPSKSLNLPEMAAPFAAQGWAVVLPDYAGLGSEGVQGYADTLDTTASVLDSLRALHAFVAPGSLDDSYAVIGHSQGGGAALNTQGLASQLEQKLQAVVAFASGWVSSAEPPLQLYQAPQFIPVTVAAGVSAVVMAYSLYAEASNFVDADNPGLFFSDQYREEIVDWIESECVGKVASNFLFMGPAVTAKDILSPVYLNVMLSCIKGEPGCTEPYKSVVERRKAHYLPMDPQGAPVLMIQGMSDLQSTPKRAACYVEAMEASGFKPLVSLDPEATHFDVVERNLGLAFAWIQAKMKGSEPPTWPFDATTLPTCD